MEAWGGNWSHWEWKHEGAELYWSGVSKRREFTSASFKKVGGGFLVECYEANRIIWRVEETYSMLSFWENLPRPHHRTEQSRSGSHYNWKPPLTA